MGEELRIEVPGLRLSALAWGPPDGRPLLALHGWLDNAASFAPLAPLLAGFRLVALDAAGHGASQHRPRGQHYHLVDFVADAWHAANALGWGEFDLLGHSLGASIAAMLAAAAPERVGRLALVEGLGPLTETPEQAPDRLLRSAQAMAALDAKTARTHPDPDSAARARQRAGDLSLAAARLLSERNSREQSGLVAWRTDPQLRLPSPLYLTEPQVLAYLGRIRAPTLCLLGAEGYLHDRPFMAQRYARVADLRRVTLPGGHHLHMDHPDACAGVIEAFLHGVER